MRTFITIAIFFIGFLTLFIGIGTRDEKGDVMAAPFNKSLKAGKRIIVLGMFIIAAGFILLWRESIIAGSVVTFLALLSFWLYSLNPYYFKAKHFFEIYCKLNVNDVPDNQFVIQRLSAQTYLMSNKKITSYDFMIDAVFENGSAIDLKELAYSLLRFEEVYVRDGSSNLFAGFVETNREMREKIEAIDKAYKNVFRENR
jgi:hypothetical protein